MNRQPRPSYIEEIILPYVKEKRRQLHLEDDHPALVLFDVFKGQCTEEVLWIVCQKWPIRARTSHGTSMRSSVRSTVKVQVRYRPNAAGQRSSTTRAHAQSRR